MPFKSLCCFYSNCDSYVRAKPNFHNTEGKRTQIRFLTRAGNRILCFLFRKTIETFLLKSCKKIQIIIRYMDFLSSSVIGIRKSFKQKDFEKECGWNWKNFWNKVLRVFVEGFKKKMKSEVKFSFVFIWNVHKEVPLSSVFALRNIWMAPNSKFPLKMAGKRTVEAQQTFLLNSFYFTRHFPT